jgi:hypothetical protein
MSITRMVILAACAAMAACSHGTSGGGRETSARDYAVLGVPAPPARNVCAGAETRDAFNAAMNLTNGTFEDAIRAHESGPGGPQFRIDELAQAGAWTDIDDDGYALALMTDRKFMDIAARYPEDYEKVGYDLPATLPEDEAAPDPDALCEMNLDYYASFQRLMTRVDDSQARGHEVLDDYLAERTTED